MKKWNQVNKRLKTIIAPELKIAFNKSKFRYPQRKATAI